MNIVLNTNESYSLSELAKATTNNDDDLIYIVKKIDGKDVSIAVDRATFLQGISGGGTGKYIIYGGVAWTGTGMDFESTLISWNYYGTSGIAPITNLTLDNGDSEPRVDVFAINTNDNTVEIVKGTPSANPIVPAIDPEYIFVQSVNIASGATTPTITVDPIYRDNTDWVMTTYTSGTPTPGSVDFADTSFPFQGTFDIKSATSKSTGIRATRGASIDLTNYPTLSFSIRFETALPANRNLLASVWLSGSNLATASFQPFGIDRNLVGVWQTIILPTSIFAGATNIDRMQIRMDGGTNAQVVTYYLDNILLSTGSAVPIPLDTITILKGGANIGTRPKINFIEGTNVTFDIADDPANDRVNITINSSGGGGGGQVNTIVGTTNQITVNSADPVNPIVSLAAAAISTLAQVGTNTGNISTNTTDIANLDDRVDDVETDIVNIEIDIADIQADYVKSTADFDTAGRVVIVDSAGRKVVQGSKLLAELITEADVIDTARQYTAGQGTALGTLTIAAGSVTPDIAAKNAYSLTIDQNVTINAPSNDRCTSWFIHCEITGAGGWTIGLNSAYKPDGGTALTIPNTTGDKFTLYVQSFGDGTHDVTIHTQQ